MTVARAPEELERVRAPSRSARSTASTSGHRRVLEAASASGSTPTVVTFDPHPRKAFGQQVELLSTLERRLELLADAGIDDALVLQFDLEFARTTAEEFAERYLRGDRRGGRRRRAPRSGSATSGRATSTCSSGSASTSGRSRSSTASPRARSARS